MNVVCHKNVRVYVAVIFIGDLLQGGKIESPVFISNKTIRTVNATLDDVLRDTCYIDSGFSSNSNTPEKRSNFPRAYVRRQLPNVSQYL